MKTGLAASRTCPTRKEARLLLEFLAQPLGKLFHLFQSCVQVFGEEALPELLQICLHGCAQSRQLFRVALDCLEPERLRVKFSRSRFARNLAYPLFARIYSLVDSLRKARLLAEGRDCDKNHKQGNEAGGHTHLLRALNYKAEFYTCFSGSTRKIDHAQTLLQIQLSQLHGAVGASARSHGGGGQGGEIHAGSLSLSAHVVDDDAADSPWVVGAIEACSNAPGADVVGDHVSVRTRANQAAHQEIVVVRVAPKGQVGIVEFGVGSAREIRDVETLQVSRGSGVHRGIRSEADPIMCRRRIRGAGSTHEQFTRSRSDAPISIVKGAGMKIDASEADGDAYRCGKIHLQLSQHCARPRSTVVARYRKDSLAPAGGIHND